MRFGSLFAGVGGFDLGFENAGMECAWQVENDSFCNEVLERHWKNIRRYKDVRTVGKHNLEPVELICGGFPCQDLSVAGKRAGFGGERSSLWFEFERIVAEMQPKWVVIENVPGLLSSRGGEDFGIILKSLDEFGYGVAWRILDSQYFGVPQRRRRIFIVASLGDASCGQVLFESKSVPGNIEQGKEGREDVAYTLRASASRSGDKGDGGMSQTLIPCPAPFTPGGFGEYRKGTGALRHAGGDCGGGSETIIVMASGQANAEIVEDKSPTLSLLHEQPIVFQQNQRDEVRSLGNKAGSLVAEAGMRQQNYIWEPRSADGVPRIHEGNVSPTLNTMEGGQRQPCVGVRRLTPVECCRLQGFPDDWNDNVSDTQRYRQMGNAVTVNVIEWIGKRIIKTSDTKEVV